MGTLTHYRGNLLHTERKIIAHGVNCKGAFGAGVASQIARQFPDVKRGYLRKHENPGWKPGDCQFIMTQNRTIVVNMATQDRYGRKGVHVDYDAVRKCFDRVLTYCEEACEGLAIPKVGSGLAGGDWEQIETIIRECLAIRSVEVDVYSLE